MTFDQFKEKVYSKKIYLAEVWTGQHLQDFDKTAGYTYVYEYPIVDVPVINHLPLIQEVLENDEAMSAQTSIANVEANAGSYYFDKLNKKIYIHTTGGDYPDGLTSGKYNYTIVANFWLRFGSDGKTFNHKYYYPRIAQNGLSDLTVSSRTIFFGIQTTGNGSLRLKNEDKFFDKLLKQFIWASREIHILLGGDNLAYSNYATVFKGTIIDWTGGDQEVTLSIKDHRSVLTNKFPPNVYEKDTYPDLADTDVSKGIPIGYGYVTSAVCVKVGLTGNGIFKIVNNPIHKILKVYNNGTSIALSYITPDLVNGQFTIAFGYSGTIGTITADFIGMPSATLEQIFVDDFEDNDISEWDQYFTSGGTPTWTAAGGIVSGSINASNGAYLVQPMTRFSSGEIELKVNSSVDNGDLRIGLIWDFVSYESFKALVIAMGTPQRLRLYQVTSGTWNNLTNDSITALKDTWYTLKLALSADGVATPYIDGVAKTAYAFSAGFNPKPVGLAVYNSMTGSFDDLSIKTDYLCTGAQIVRDICVNWLDISEDDIDAASFANSMVKAPQILWPYFGTQIEAAAAIEPACHSNLCRFVIGENGKVFYDFWSSGDATVETIKPQEILGEYQAEEKEGEIYETCRVRYGRGAGTQYKIQIWGDPRVRYLYKRGITKEFETYLVVDEDAEDLAYRMFRLLQTPVTRYRFKTKMKTLNSKIGDVINLQRNRGISASGKHNTDLRVVGLIKDFSRTEVVVDAVANNAALGEARCEQTCEQTCERACQLQCELFCKDYCESYCEGTCKTHCKTTCEEHCQTTCMLIPLCESTCQSGCTDACIEGISCQSTCELSCQTACKIGCLVGCQQPCTDFCETHCQTECEQLGQ